jgi:hypothetical protein
MPASADLNSRLALASAAALVALSKLRPTSVSPLVKARPLAKKPTTGITAIAMMRLRTEILVTGAFSEKRRVIESGIAEINPALAAIGRQRWPQAMYVKPRKQPNC